VPLFIRGDISAVMVIMAIMRVLVEELLCQDSRGWRPVLENLPARITWVYGYVPSCQALNSVASLKPSSRGDYEALKGPMS
jgi:hypothetical protein